MNTQSFTQKAESPIINSAGQRPVEKKCRSNPSPNGAKSAGLRPVGALWRGLSPSRRALPYAIDIRPLAFRYNIESSFK